MTTNLMNFDKAAMQDWFTGLGEQPFRASQVLKWIYQEGSDGFDSMTNISKALREKLAGIAEIHPPGNRFQQVSQDGTVKWVIGLDDGNAVETVFIPEVDRGTLCVSSQVGCSLNCTFCSTARQGFNRNLTTAEIIGQVWLAERELEKVRGPGRHVTNVVMMGMGEPLVNFDQVVPAMNLMIDDFAVGLAKKRVTLSTAGMVPMLEKLKAACPVSLAVSLHAPNNALRNELVPLNKKYPLEVLLPACAAYVDGTRGKVTFEYVMLDGINDSPQQARELVKRLAGVPCKVNLIPFNPFPDTRYRRSAKRAIDAFRDIVVRAGIPTVTRKTRGDDIDAACGQLVGDVMDRTRRSQRLAAQVKNQ